MNEGRHRLLRRSPLQAAFRARARERLTVLCYHGVDDPESFARHLDYLAARTVPVTLDQVAGAVLDGRPLPRRALLLTFDDGERSLLEDGAPLMRARGIPGVAFVVAGLLDSAAPFWWREVKSLVAAGGRTPAAPFAQPEAVVQALKRLPDQGRRDALGELRDTAASPAPPTPQMRRDELFALEDAGIAVASHTLSHPCLNRCTEATIREELERSRAVIEGALGHSCTTIAYPNGDWDARVLGIAAAAGYRIGFRLTGRSLPRTPPRDLDPLLLPRVPVESTASVDRLAILTSGLLPALLRARARTGRGSRALPAEPDVA